MTCRRMFVSIGPSLSMDTSAFRLSYCRQTGRKVGKQTGTISSLVTGRITVDNVFNVSPLRIVKKYAFSKKKKKTHRSAFDRRRRAVRMCDEHGAIGRLRRHKRRRAPAARIRRSRCRGTTEETQRFKIRARVCVCAKMREKRTYTRYE